jgi:hypothetical protein
MRIGCPKKASPLEVTVAINTKLRSVAVPEVRDDAQSTLLRAMSASRDSTCVLLISKLKTFEKTLLAAQKLYAGHDYVIQSAPTTLITELLLID